MSGTQSPTLASSDNVGRAQTAWVKTAHRLAAGSIAGCTEICFTMPFETIKTRMQFEQQVAGTGSRPVARPGMVGTCRAIVEASSVRGLYYGLPICLVQSSIKNAVRFALFEQLKGILGQVGAMSAQHRTFVAGAGAGAIEAAIWVAPTERLKTLRQTQVRGSSVGAAAVWLLRGSRCSCVPG
jgi:hypothetical protein